MKIKKIGHCCLVLQTNGLTVLTDPGSFSDEQNSLTGIDVVLITHEHGDHFHVESVQEILKNNPKAQVITNSGVGAQLDVFKIPYTLLEDTSSTSIQGVHFEASDGKHEEIFEEIGQVQNTGYFIDSLFYPGDAFHLPGKEVGILALPVAGPWCKLADAIRYALAVKPKKAFPVHDAMLKGAFTGFVHNLPKTILGQHGIEFTSMCTGDKAEF
ncbi:MAG: MBL fold metallo-hydrolase [bacterium]